MQVSIDSFASTGKGVATIIVDGFKRAVFVQGGIPGDVCEVNIDKQYKNYYEASIVKLLSPSKHRINPPCEVFGTCGACNWLNIDYSFQLESKKQILSFLLSKLNLTPSIEIISCDNSLFYRDKVRVQFKDGKASFYKRQSNDLVFPKKCHIINKNFNDYFDKKTSFIDGEKTFVFNYKDDSVVLDPLIKPSYSYKDIIYTFGFNSFIQSNLKQNEKLIDLVLSLVSNKTVLELYCGMGNFTLPLAKQNKSILAVEGNLEAIDLLKSNLKNNDILGVNPVCNDVREFILSLDRNFDIVVLDPPRVGVDDVNALTKLSSLTNELLYISCDPNSLVKDLKILLKNNFTLEKVFIIDMFPQTNHFETLVFLNRAC